MSCSVRVGTGNFRHNYDNAYRSHLKNVDGSKSKENILLKEFDWRHPDVAFNKIFEGAVTEYNEGKRKDRQIKNYYEHCLNDGHKGSKKIKPIREIIFQIGNAQDATDPKNRKIMIDTLKEMYHEFEQYSQIEVLGAVIHQDETVYGNAPELHIDYVPIAYQKGKKKDEIKKYTDKDGNEKQKRVVHSKGLSKKVNQDLCLKQMGFVPEYSEVNRKEKEKPIVFNGFRNELTKKMQAILKSYGIERKIIKAPNDHKSVSDYRTLQDEKKQLKTENEQLKAEQEQLEAENLEASLALETINGELYSQKNEILRLEQEKSLLEEQNADMSLIENYDINAAAVYEGILLRTFTDEQRQLKNEGLELLCQYRETSTDYTRYFHSRSCFYYKLELLQDSNSNLSVKYNEPINMLAEKYGLYYADGSLVKLPNHSHPANKLFRIATKVKNNLLEILNDIKIQLKDLSNGKSVDEFFVSKDDNETKQKNKDTINFDFA